MPPFHTNAAGYAKIFFPRCTPRAMVSPIMKRLLAVFLLAGISFGFGACRSAAPSAPAQRSKLLILVSIDGFRWDYLQKYEAPTLRALAAGGVQARRMTPSFPSKTFPNHYTLVTGLYPEHHGIVSNWFFDPAFNETFGMSRAESNHEPRWWAGGEPVWITAEKQGLRSACFFWPGSETENHGTRPSFFKPFDKTLNSLQRVDGLLEWLKLPADQRPRLATLYFDIVDTQGHDFGPDSPETAAAVKETDAALAHLLDGLAARGLRDKTDLVIVSDHGMSECGPDRVIFLEDLMDLSQVQVESTGPNGGVRPKPGGPSAAELVAAIRTKHVPHLQIYRREEVPARLHYRDNPRIPPVVLIADDHWNIESNKDWARRAATYVKGSHGWDPALPNMGALFIASGPSFKHGHAFADVENIHVYNLLCAALGLKPAPNDGDDRLVREALVR
jgi:predicted AlkP superfamily pyrophosphatase or phosphodiesterase